MNFLRPGIAHHANQLAAGGAADDGVVDQDDALALENGAYRIQLEFDAKISHALAGLDERPPHVVITDQAKLERDATLAGITHGRSDAGIWNRNNEIGIHRGFSSQLAAQFFAALVYGTAEDHAVRAGEVHMLEDAAGLRQRGRIEARRNAFRADDDHLPRLHFADILRADKIESTGFRSKDNCVADLPRRSRNTTHRQGTEAARIAGGENVRRRHHHQRKCAFHPPQGIGQGFRQRLLA